MGKLRCPICRSKQWRKEPSSGMLICGEGHVLQGYRKETREVTEMSQHVMHKRTLKKTPTISQSAQPNSAHYSGEEARFLYSQSLQLLFRLQVAALQKLWSLPPGFEALCRDVWSLHLLMLPHGIDAALVGDEPPRITSNGKETSSDSDEASELSRDEGPVAKRAADTDLSKLLAGLSDASSDSDSQVSQPNEERNEAANRTITSRNKLKLAQPYNTPLSNIAVLVTACWIIRVPVIYTDFIRLIQTYELPYLDPVQRGLLPQPMVVHMRKEVIKALSPLQPPRSLELHRLSSRLARGFKERYQISIPEANTPHILLRAINALHLPSEFYSMIKSLANKLAVPLTLHPSLSAVATNEHGKMLNYQIGDNIPTEMALACVIVLLLKLIYGLDDHSRDISEEGSLLGLPSKAEIMAMLRQDEGSAEAARSLTALDLSESEVDQYLDFCVHALIGKQVEGSDPALGSTFPLHSTMTLENFIPPWPNSQLINALEPPTNTAFQDTEEGPNKHFVLPGQKHAIYCTIDILGLLPEDYQLVISRAAAWCNTAADDLASIVERYERRLLRQLERAPKAKKGNELVADPGVLRNKP